METTTGSATESAELAEASGLSIEQVEAKLADGFLFYREPDYFGGKQPPGEWIDAKPTEFVVCGHGYYGRSNTVVAAKANFRQYGGRLKDGYVILEFGPGSAFVGISAMGWRYLGDPPKVTEVQPR